MTRFPSVKKPSDKIRGFLIFAHVLGFCSWCV
jgi:hypothetical protein